MSDVFYVVIDCPAAHSAALKMADAKPGAIINMTAEEMKIITDPEKFMVLPFPEGVKND